MFSWDGTYARAAAWVLLVLVIVLLPQSGFLSESAQKNSLSETIIEDSNY
jgi:hypothetical protein